MSNNINAYEHMGSILAQLPFRTSLNNIHSDTITEQEQEALNRALQTTVSMLIQARQYYGLDDEAIEACARGFATELSSTFIGPRIVRKVDQHLTDEQGNVWRKLDECGY